MTKPWIKTTPARSQRTVQPGKSTSAKDGRGRKRLLLVEDHAALLSLRSIFLTSQGYHVVCAHDALQALSFLDTQLFHLVVTDAALPGPSGWEVAAAARRRNVPVILSSGRPAGISAEEAVSRGVDFLCPKPCSLNQLQLLVEKALRQGLTSNIRLRPVP